MRRQDKAKSPDGVLNTPEEYRRAIARAARLRDAGATAAENDELAAIEGAIARYVAQPGRPAARKGRPKKGGTGM